MTCADRLAHRTCKMSHTRIDRDDAVHEVQQCSRIAEVSQIVPEECDATVLPKHCNVLFSDVLLQAYPVSICSENRKKLLQFYRAVMIILVKCTAAPDQAYSRIRLRRQSSRTSSSQSLVSPYALGLCWDRFKRICSGSGKLNKRTVIVESGRRLVLINDPDCCTDLLQ